jgi:SAM-dependent methyltransferase/ribosomal protein S18 acetylase RimI-like enzyme
MKTAIAVTFRQTAAAVVEKTAAAHREYGLGGVASRVCHRAAAPIVKWGGISFFKRRLDGTVAPASPSPAGVFIRQLSISELDAILEGGDPDQDALALAERFRRGERAFGAIDATGRLCHVRWVSTGRVHIPEIHRDILLRPGEAYFYNGYTRPDARRRGIDSLVRHAIFDVLRSEGFTTACSYVRGDNPAGLRAASRWQRPAGTVRYVTLHRCKPLLIGTSTTGLPELTEPAGTREVQTARVEAWRAWFTSWIGEPLSKRSTGCAALNEAAFESSAAFIEKSLALSQVDTVLDVGCDSAMITRLIAPHARRVLGIDFIHDMLRDTNTLRLAVADGTAPWFVTADACRLPVRSGTFKKVYCSAMLHTLPTREHGLSAIEELVRVASPGGIVLIASVPDASKRFASRIDIWKRARAIEKVTLPVRWLVPTGIKRLSRRMLRLPATGLPEFLDYDLQGVARSFEARGLRCEVRDFPTDYWSGEFTTSRSNLLIFIPHVLSG